MKRLTYFDGGKWRLKIGDKEYSGAWVDRLAAYEDTGLEPEEIGALKSREKGLVELLNGVSCGCAVTYTRLRELAQADRDGKLPKYTIGDTVYDRFGDAWEVRTEELHLLDGNPNWIYRCGHAGTDDYCALWEFKILPREEAEAALRREQDGE